MQLRVVPPQEVVVPPPTLTSEELQHFVGGHFEVRCARERYHFRGEIGTICIDAGKLVIAARTMLQKKIPGRTWAPYPNEHLYTIDLGVHTVDYSGERIRLTCIYNRETTTLIPQGREVVENRNMAGVLPLAA